MKRFTRVLFVLGVVFLLAVSTVFATVIPVLQTENGMIVSAHPFASEIGLEILREGGNAIDAAVGVSMALGVVEPYASGIGGEGVMLIYSAQEDKIVCIDFKSMAPRLATYEVLDFSKLEEWEYTPKAVGIPGIVAGMAKAIEKYGTMSLEKVLEGPITLARDGYPVSKTMATLILDKLPAYDLENYNPETAKIYMPGGFPAKEGQIIKNPDLAHTLELIANKGPEVFYKGEIGISIAKDMKEHGGLIYYYDLLFYKAIVKEPTKGTYRGYKIYSSAPPCAGATLIEILNIMENFELAKYGFLSPTYIHIIAEAVKLGNVDRYAHVADPDFVKVPIKGLTSKEYAKERAKLINLNKAKTKGKIKEGDPSVYKCKFPIEDIPVLAYAGSLDRDGSTTHFVVADKEGNVVSVTQTNSSFWGCGWTVTERGFLLNNEMKNFSSRPGLINSLEPGKRMRTTICPSIITKDGKPFLTVGTPGAGRIVSTLAQTISAVIDYNLPLQDAIEAPKFYSKASYGNKLYIEARLSDEVLEVLTKLGHEIKNKGKYDLYFGGIHGIMFEGGKMVSGADPRRGGIAKGY